ncbi:MAG: hypothetical protein M3237_03345 [Actinomycetota bacterium]|nr:hypothetical protein [Actinomycetota bacterium]
MTDEDSTPDQPAVTETPAKEAPARTRWRERALGFRGVVAVALATLILGGLGGTAIGMAVSGDDHDRQRQGPGDFEMHDGGRPPGGGVPPGTAPEDDVQPDSSGETPSGTTS